MAASIELAKTDITRMRVDAIVNAANEALQLGSGVAGAIRQHGGPTIQEECDQIGTCAIGQAVVTKAGKLSAKWVIHAVGPVWKGGTFGEEMLLASLDRYSVDYALVSNAEASALTVWSTTLFIFSRLSFSAASSFTFSVMS